MKNLIKAELFKLKKLTAYKVLVFTYLIEEVIVQINNIGNSVAYPKYNPTYTGIEWLMNPEKTFMLHSMVIVFYTAYFVNGDFVGHTFYSSLLCGIPRKNAFLAKVIAALAGTVPLMLVYSLPGTLLWSIHAGFGMDFGAEVVFLIAKAFARQILISLLLVSNTVLFSSIAKSKIGTFGWTFGTLYVLSVFQGNIERIIPIPAFREMVLFLLSLFYLNIGTLLASVLLKLLAAGYIFEKYDLK
ncbi:MAG: hypothetical protein K2K70_02120 [Lachnospiraceae bacterium]|nr:hypothetical protein [Lachnospiraceae bacterium]